MNLSIIIPTYNRNQKIGECLQALGHNDAEILVVDDGSATPVTVPAAGIPFRCIRHDSNRGRAAALNTGLRAATQDLVLVIDDDIYASPDMVVRLVDEFVVWNNPKLALAGRVVWDPEILLTPTMRWLEEFGPLRDVSANRPGMLSNLTTRNTILWRPFILENGGFDENFTSSGLEDIELGLRLRKEGLETRLLSSAVGYHNKVVRVEDLVRREQENGRSSVYLHSKFPDFIPQVADVESLMRNVELEKEAVTAVEALTLLETSDSSRVPAGAADLYMLVYRHYFLQGIVNGLADLGSAQQARRSNSTLALYNEASRLESIGELGEARRMFRLVREREDSGYWAGAEYHMGRIANTLGNHDIARIHFEDCLALDPNHGEAREALALTAF
jgi:glycosyltransferase involved in cell wall biosynthesis